jgi:hypothetical protein
MHANHHITKTTAPTGAAARKKGTQLVDNHHVALWPLTRMMAVFGHTPHGLFQA